MNRACWGAALVVGSVLTRASVAQAYELQMTPANVPVRWLDAEVVFRFELDDRDADLGRGEATGAATRALGTWSAAGGPLLVGEEGDHKPKKDEEERDSGESHTIRFARDIDDPDIDPAALALTHLRYDPASGAISGVSIAINAAAFRWATDGECDAAYDLESTIAHEIGHALGLRHSLVPGATMFTSPLPCDRSRRDLAQDDLDGIAALYGGTVVQGVTPDQSSDVAAGCTASGIGAAGSSQVAGFLLAVAAALLATRRGRVSPAAGRPGRGRRRW